MEWQSLEGRVYSGGCLALMGLVIVKRGVVSTISMYDLDRSPLGVSLFPILLFCFGRVEVWDLDLRVPMSYSSSLF